MFKRFGAGLMLLIAGNFIFPAVVWSEAQTSQVFSPNVLGITIFQSSPVLPNPNELLSLINQSRLDLKLPPLRANKSLELIAEKRADDMVRRQYYAHKDPDGQYYYDLLAVAGLNPDYSCENLDLLFTQSNQNAVSDWLNSTTGHRECALNPNLVEAGYAAAKLTRINLNGETTTAYLVVAVHATLL